MAIKIGHASIDENGKGRNGRAGDQTGKEVCVRTWYDKGWTVVLRPKNPTVAEKSAKACEAGCANSNIGYDMNQRNTLHTQAKMVGYDLAKIKTPCETDCSEFMTICGIAGGVKSLEHTGNAPTTSTMRRVFEATGEYEVLTDKKYLTSDEYLKRGDVLVAEGHHTVMVLENGAKVAASTAKASASPSSAISYYPKYTGKSDSIVDALNAVGVDATKSNRAKIAKANGINGYSGTVVQNMKLLSLLKAGQLKKGKRVTL